MPTFWFQKTKSHTNKIQNKKQKSPEHNYYQYRHTGVSKPCGQNVWSFLELILSCVINMLNKDILMLARDNNPVVMFYASTC